MGDRDAQDPTPDRTRLAALVVRVASHRDVRAFADLFDYYAPRVQTYLVRIGCEPATAEEITQEVMTVLWQKADLFDPERSSLSTWLFRIARNRRIDLLRRTRNLVFDDERVLAVVDDADSPDAEIDSVRTSERVRAALAHLPAEQRDLVLLSFFEDRSHSDIATAKGLPLGTVKSRIRLAFTQLRRALDAYRHD